MCQKVKKLELLLSFLSLISRNTKIEGGLFRSFGKKSLIIRLDFISFLVFLFEPTVSKHSNLSSKSYYGRRRVQNKG